MAATKKAKTSKKTTASKPAKKAAKKAASAGGKGLHTEHEDFPWTINIPNHSPRTDSDAYKVARKVMNGLVKGVKSFYLGSGPYQDHHGGGLWVKDRDGWFLIKNLAGMEWSQQFCADPAKVDMLRQFAERIYRAFPDTLPTLKAMGFQDVDAVLNETIDSPDKVSRWCDSVFNASVPLNQQRHTGTVKGKGKKPTLEGGVHHYPTPITDIQLFKRDDFQLWVMDDEGNPTAVTPVAHGDSRVRVAYATPGSKLHKQLVKAQSERGALVADGGHSLAKQAFASQT